MADVGPELVGVHDAEATAPYVARAADDRLENVLGADRPLVVVTGDRLAGTSRAVHRGLRRMLGDTRLLAIADPHTVDLARALTSAAETAARSGPVVVLADDAPPALLDQVVPDVVGRLSTDVRLVLTTRRTSLDAFVAGPTRALLDEALVTMPADGTPAGEQVRPVLRARAILDPVGWSSLLPLALLRTAVDWERLDVPAPLTPQLLAEVAPVHLAALGVPAPEPEELRRVARDLVRADHGGMRLLRATRRDGRVHLAADRLFSHLADRDAAGWAVPEELARDLWGRLGPEERARTARVALARGDDQVALWLATQVAPDDLEPEALYRLGVTLARALGRAHPRARPLGPRRDQLADRGPRPRRGRPRRPRPPDDPGDRVAARRRRRRPRGPHADGRAPRTSPGRCAPRPADPDARGRAGLSAAQAATRRRERSATVRTANSTDAASMTSASSCMPAVPAPSRNTMPLVADAVMAPR